MILSNMCVCVIMQQQVQFIETTGKIWFDANRNARKHINSDKNKMIWQGTLPKVGQEIVIKL